MMISFNDTLIKRLKSLYTSFCKSYRSLDWSQINTITLQLPYQLSASSDYTHSLSVTFLCPPRLPPRTGFYSAPRTCPCVSTPRGQAHAPTRLTSITRRRSASWADHVISFPAARACMSRLACHVTPTRYWNALTPDQVGSVPTPDWPTSRRPRSIGTHAELAQLQHWPHTPPTEITKHAMHAPIGL